MESRPVRVGAEAGTAAGSSPPTLVEAIAAESERAVENMLARARDEARAILEQADHDAADRREAAAREGYAQGLRQGRAAWDQALDALREAVTEPLLRLQALKDVVRLLDDRVVLATAAALAEQVIGEALADQERLWKRARALAAAVAGERVTLYCAPEVFAQLEALSARVADAGRAITLLRDESLGPADLVAEGEGGGADGTVLSTLRHMLEEVEMAHGDSHEPGGEPLG
jgi:flagellar assembly protein FliH